jgi:trehalose-6-phosphate synthase
MDMPAKERLDRWQRMAATVRTNTAAAWCRRFLTALEGAEAVAEAGRAGGEARARPRRQAAG